MDTVGSSHPGPPGRPGAAGGIDLNADLGEQMTGDEALLAVVTSANVACGYHAGTLAIMRAVCDGAAGLGVAIGAHVSYADREHFGRLARRVSYHVLREQVADQVGTLSGCARAAGTAVRYIKPHGALYHRVIDDRAQAAAVLDGSVLDGSVLDGSVLDGSVPDGRAGLPVLGMPGQLLRLAAEAGRPVFHEGFPDRGYTVDGRLIARTEPGALIGDEAGIVAQARALAGRVDSLCLHGDSPGAAGHARAVRRALESAGFALRPFV